MGSNRMVGAVHLWILGGYIRPAVYKGDNHG